MKSNTFELLAPAGSFDILKAVVDAGADAVYVGGELFGARAYANNFTEEELLQAIDYVHLRNCRLFLTVNTLMKNIEIEKQLFSYMKPLYEAGLDGVIVQDLGAIAFLHEAFPQLEIHTSTQMTVTGIEGVRLLQTLGVSRVVMAREVSLKEMEHIHKETGMELEAFVHGALCYSYSGQCLFSSMLGGRSGNRGRCAQPCRLCYTVLDEQKKECQKDSYILSLKDMCGITDLPALNHAGVYSLKIEGRMKQAEYAAGVVSVYRKYIDLFLSSKEHNDEFEVLEKDKNLLMQFGNRCGFTDSYYHKQNDSDMVTYVKPSYEREDTTVLASISKKKIPLDGELLLSKGKKSVLSVRSQKYAVTVEGPEPSQAQNRPLLKEDVISRMKKTGDTAFHFSSFEVEMENDLFVPNGVLNQLRRDAIEKLETYILGEYKRNDSTLPHSVNKKSADTESDNLVYIAAVMNSYQLEKVLMSEDISEIYLESVMYDYENLIAGLKEDVERIHLAGKKAVYAFPQIFREKTVQKYSKIYDKLCEIPLDGVLVRNYEQLWIATEVLSHLEVRIDHNMYTYNDRAVEAFDKYQIKGNTVPLELNRQEIAHRQNANSEMIVYGYYPLMTTAGCVHKNTQGCDHKKTTMYLKDRYQTEFAVKNNCDECFNVVYNSVPTLLLGYCKELQNAGIARFRLNFTTENSKEVDTVLDMLHNQLSTGVFTMQGKEKYTNGHYKRGVE